MRYTSAIRTLLFVMLIVAGTACTGLAGEPEIVSTLPVRATSQPPALEVFNEPVNLQRGAIIFAENCVRCHGIGGAGDGEFVQNGQIQNIPDFTNPQTIQDTSLQEWFDTITNGRLEALMPPWKDSLSAYDRWSVALYTYTMSYTPQTITQGQEHYVALCADCHAVEGSGTESGTSLQGLVSFTGADLQNAIATHQTDLQLSPQLTDTQLQSTVQYVRMLSSLSRELPDSTALAQQPPPATTEEAAPPSQTTPVDIPQSIGIITGRITQGTEGGADVEGLTAVVHIYDSQLREQVGEYIVGADGTYQYDEVVIRPDFAYRMTVEYDGVTYSSPVYIGDPAVTDMVIDVTVYEKGATVSDLVITSRATQINLSTGGLYIIEVIDMLNTSNSTYYRDNVDGISGKVSVGFPLPEGAQLQLEHTDPNRILLSDDGKIVYDSAPVLPNSEHYVQYSYLLPIENARNIPQPIDYNVSGAIAFFVENSHLDFAGDGLQLVQTRTFNNQQYDVYEVANTPEVGTTLTYDVILSTTPLSSPTSQSAFPRELVAFILLLAGLILVGGAGFVIWRGRHHPASDDTDTEDTTASAIMRQIARLDNAFEAGDIDKAEYEKQRNQLKSRLMQIMKTQEDV